MGISLGYCSRAIKKRWVKKMTELKSIWHTADEKPMLQRDIILCGDGWSMAIDIIPETVNNICWKNVEKWCYLDDLLDLEHENKDLSDKIGKLETELERTRKALGIAVDELRELKETVSNTEQELSMTIQAANALEQITALEQKE